MKCNECRFWHGIGNLANPNGEVKGFGECHRYPPLVVPSFDRTRWPLTYHDDECGEWRDE